MNTVNLPAPETTDGTYFDVGDARAAIADGRSVTFPPFEIVGTDYEGECIFFACNFKRDPIQAFHRRGAFYEGEDLETTLEYLPKGARILDVGANVGNHALYFALHGAASIVVVEPNPLAQAPLVANVVLNRLTKIISLEALGPGLGAASEAGLYMKPHDRNLGATKMKRGHDGLLEVHAGDDLFAEQVFDLIKIDVEGMELEVLAGLEQTIESSRPLIFVEVDHRNADAFDAWIAVHQYRIAEAFTRYSGNQNFLLQSED